jgi:large subunit ribosomal protein L29
MGQTESLKKIRELKKDIARVKTVTREKQIAGGNGASAPQTVAVSAPAPAEKTAKKKAAKKTAATEKQ